MLVSRCRLHGTCHPILLHTLFIVVTYWRVKFWNNSDSMHPSVLDNVIDILFCINVGFVVVSTLGKKRKEKPLRMTKIN